MIIRILITLFLVAVCAVLAFLSWNGWIAEQGVSNRVMAMLAHAQGWLVTNIGAKPTAGIFAFLALFFAWVGFFSEKTKR